MIGQIELNKKLNNLTIDNFPNSLILAGEFGCGKHLLVNEICNKLNIEATDISETVDDELILELQQKSEPFICILDSNKITEKSQNVILKFLEEPTEYTHLIVLCESIDGLLPTIINRCEIWKFERYNKEELKQFSNLVDNDFEILYNILNTPGKLLSIKDIDIHQYIELSKKVFNVIDIALISNILILPGKLQYNNGKDIDKLSFDIFVDLLLNSAFEYYKENKIGYSSYLLTNNLKSDSKIFSIDKKKLYENYLIELKDDIKRFKNGN